MKGLTRSTQAILRTGEILATLARTHGSVTESQWGRWFESLETARRNVGLFQHHDGVTGTARRVVVEDYASRLLGSLAEVVEHSSGNLRSLSLVYLFLFLFFLFFPLFFLFLQTDMALAILSKSGDASSDRLSWVTEPAKQISMAIPRIIQVEKGGAVVVVFNSLAHSRSEVVSVLVSIQFPYYFKARGEIISIRLFPQFLLFF